VRIDAGRWVEERVVEFVRGLLPLVEADRVGGAEGGGGKGRGVGMTLVAGKGAGKGGRRGGLSEKGGENEKGVGKYVLNTFGPTMEEMSARFQAFYEGLEKDLRATAATSTSSGGASVDAGSEEKVDGEKEKEWAKREEQEQKDGRVRAVMEVVEKVVCELFYDRYVFPPPPLSLYRPLNTHNPQIVPPTDLRRPNAR
jgi:hypothetical protein